MKKKIKKIQSILLLGIFLLFNSLLLISLVEQTYFLSSDGESVSYCCTDLNTTGIQSLFNEEETDDFDKDFIVSIQQLLFFSPSSFKIKLIDSKSNKHFQNFIFAFQSDLPPPQQFGFRIEWKQRALFPVLFC